MLNHIVLMGRLVADPELRQTPGGVPVATFRIAVDRDFKNKETGEKETDFITIVSWRGTAELVSEYFTKGRMVVVEGRLQIRPYTDRDGNKRTATEVVAERVYFGDSKRDDQGGYPSGGSGQGGRGSPGRQPSGGYPRSDYSAQASPSGQFTELDDDDDDELPF